ncbi:MAG TPA: DegT/DnrJ/EryC1/StrS family aminotransferase [Opitutaceae bacterium]
MSAPSIPLMRPEIGDEEITLVTETLRSGWITQGPRVRELEAEFCAATGAAHAIAVANCTAALHLALLVLDIGEGDEVIVPPHSYIATANAVLYTGATPRFADIDPLTLNIDPAKVAAAITPRTKAILVVHQVGRPANLSALADLARRHGIPLIEDAACAAGSRYQDQPIGGNRWSSLVCFSFHPRKIISTGDGGMITTDRADLAARLRLLRQHGMSVNDLQRHGSKTVVAEEYPILGYNYRLTDVQAAIGLAQLRKVPALVARRREIAARYDAAFAAQPGITLFAEPADARWNQQTYLIRLATKDVGQRDAFMQRLLDEGIASRRGIMSIHREPAYTSRFGPQSFPESESASDQCVCLPLYTQMTDVEINRVIDAVRRLAPR